LAQVAFAHQTSLFGPAIDYRGSELPEFGRSGLFAVHGPAECEVALLDGGEDSLAVRLDLLKRARRSIRVQALIFTADESGLRVAELLKQRKRDGLDVRIIVDAASNSSLQTQWMYFDLKQHGIEVEGYEAIALQWINELPVLMPHPSELTQPNQRFHEKLWIVDGEAPDALAVTGGLNIANEYFRVNPGNPDRYWRDQDVLVRGAVVRDLVTAFDRNFEYFVSIKRSRGVFNTNRYWDAMRKVVARTGKVPIVASTTAQLVENVAALEARTPPRRFSPSTCRFLQSRPRLRESYIQQAYLKLLAGAKREVLIANAYFVPTASLRAAIRDAVQRCVAVTLLCNGPETNDTPGISLLGRSYYRELLAGNDTAIRSLALPGLVYVTGVVDLRGLPLLAQLSLDNLTSIGADLLLGSLSRLGALSGLPRLRTIGGNFTASSNAGPCCAAAMPRLPSSSIARSICAATNICFSSAVQSLKSRMYSPSLPVISSGLAASVLA
ncbi:MAG: phosphatidylserine/phosphatidylglycerophosphate/cardiolipin synthase family protein, partial [Myxococcales bacterium]|nr:phosphatidylserine/phosphatidylglycerophosphate/cardiolipin synthase family protein [Myxococcales bacterium]